MDNINKSKIDELLKTLMTTVDPDHYKPLLEQLQANTGEQYGMYLAHLLQHNPFLKVSVQPDLANSCNPILIWRQQLAQLPGIRICVFCMPKSGSSFLAHCIQQVLDLPFVGLTSFIPMGNATLLGMDGREQEIDEFALISALSNTNGQFIAQHHTRCTPYLCSQCQFYNLFPIISIRNIFDALVSNDNMMVQNRSLTHNLVWKMDPIFPLPLHYPSLPDTQRYLIMAQSIGLWYINFYLTWKRCERAGLVNPCWISYEDDLVNHEQLHAKLTAFLQLDANQQQRLRYAIEHPDLNRARFNRGITGRGQLVPEAIKEFLIGYAQQFANELDATDFHRLFGLSVS
jgi:hypothetical protein